MEVMDVERTVPGRSALRAKATPHKSSVIWQGTYLSGFRMSGMIIIMVPLATAVGGALEFAPQTLTTLTITLTIAPTVFYAGEAGMVLRCTCALRVVITTLPRARITTAVQVASPEMYNKKKRRHRRRRTEKKSLYHT